MARRRTTFKVRHRVGRQHNDRMRNHQAVFAEGAESETPVETGALLLSGDQSGVLLLSGDQQSSGTDALLLSGDVL